MIIVVDTNIIFSCLLNTQGSISNLFFSQPNSFKFYSNEYMRFEIRKHWDKLKKISKLNDDQLTTSYTRLLTKISFVKEEAIPAEIWRQAEIMVDGIDEDDIDFVALTLFLDGSLWTGDKPLYAGLKAKGFKQVYNTLELLELRNNLIGQ